MERVRFAETFIFHVLRGVKMRIIPTVMIMYKNTNNSACIMAISQSQLSRPIHKFLIEHGFSRIGRIFVDLFFILLLFEVNDY